MVLAAILPDLQDVVSASAWTYLLVLGVAAGDAVLPLLPSETVVIAAAALAAEGRLSIALVVAAAIVGAFAGDNGCYGLGTWVGEPVARRLFAGEKGRRRVDWARRQLHRRGAGVIVVARFIPGGRTATTFVSGTLDFPWRRFALADAGAAVLWATYAALLGYVGGATFRGNTWLAIGVALGIGALVTGAVEGVRRLRGRREA